MKTAEPFQRARRPEQKEERRLHLLETARAALLGGAEVNALGLNELARQAQMTKSNVYRYFENREALLLALLEEESAQWRGELGARLAAVAHPTAEQIARAFAGASAAYPLMCRLLSVLPSIIEHNVSPERVVEFKLGTIALVADVAAELHHMAPALPMDAYTIFFRLAMALMIGLWPLSRPPEAVADAMSLPALQPLRYDFESDLATSLQLILQGLSAHRPGGAPTPVSLGTP